MSKELSELIHEAEQLTTDEQLRLIAHLAQNLSTTSSSHFTLPSTPKVPEKTVGQSLLELFDSITADMTPEEIAALPSDGAAQHDHYIYGTPKRQQ